MMIITSERIQFRNSRGLNLVGDLQSTSSKAIVITAPGSCSDRSSQGRFGILANALNKHSISTLAIDFSGCGESDDDANSINSRNNMFRKQNRIDKFYLKK